MPRPRKHEPTDVLTAAESLGVPDGEPLRVLDLACALGVSLTMAKQYVRDMERQGLWRWAKAKGGFRKIFRAGPVERPDPTPTPANREEWRRRKEILDEVRAEMFADPTVVWDEREYHRRLDARLDTLWCNRRQVSERTGTVCHEEVA
jgi:hypothetical protein